MIYKTNSGYGVNFNQLIQNGNFENGTTGFGSRWFVSPKTVSSGVCTINGSISGADTYNTPNISITTANCPDFVIGHKYLTLAECKSVNLVISVGLAFGEDIFRDYQAINDSDFTQCYWFTDCTKTNKIFGLLGGKSSQSTTEQAAFQLKNFQLFDLTQDFGSGNEPTTVAEFREMYPDDYYDYTLSQWQWLKKGKITSYPTPCFGVDFNQKFNSASPDISTRSGVSCTRNNNVFTFSGTATASAVFSLNYAPPLGHKILYSPTINRTENLPNWKISQNYMNDIGEPLIREVSRTGCVLYAYFVAGWITDGLSFSLNIFDLTQMYGEGNEPETVEEFRSKFPDDYYPYTLSEMRYINEKTSYTLLPIEHHIVGVVKPELSDISLLKLKTGSYKNTNNQGPYVEVKEGNEIVINTPSTDALYGMTILPILSEITLKAGHTYYCFLDGQKKSGDWNAITMDYTGGGGPVSYLLYVGNVNTITLETDKTISSARAYLNSTSTHYDNYSVRLIITENRQYLIDKGIISQ